jgi:hypothetical protein
LREVEGVERFKGLGRLREVEGVERFKGLEV